VRGGHDGRGAAYVRARETGRPDRLFADPWAAEFVSKSGWSPPLPAERGETDDESKRNWAALEFWLVVRTRFLDEFVLTASAAGCRQIVALGAGLDARAFRLEWPSGVRLFELTYRTCWSSRGKC
jgi:methyltransferase (TIGR00027 family)